jgi:hypothetical protein
MIRFTLPKKVHLLEKVATPGIYLGHQVEFKQYLVGFMFPKDVIHASRMISKDVTTTMEGTRLTLTKDATPDFDWIVETMDTSLYLAYPSTKSIGLTMPIRIIFEDDRTIVYETVQIDPGATVLLN